MVDEDLYLAQQKADLTVPAVQLSESAVPTPQMLATEAAPEVVLENEVTPQEGGSNISTEPAPDGSELEPKAKKAKKKSGGNA